MSVRPYALTGMFMLLALAPAYAAERETNLQPETVASVDCPASDCFVVPAAATYCSLDPYRLVEGRLFASKAALTLPAGVYALDGSQALADFVVGLETPAGKRTLNPAQSDIYSLERGMDDPETGIDPLRWIEIQAPYKGPDLSLKEVFVRTSRWPHT
ncbi:MAG: hypothetical protein R3202_14220, partial [Candidatus Competibacterales bacterium]|nr:hypothetical protein [Candidatus Competibacterales bacterium]